jgi:tRNA nucleotidyltransferase/poly(A) polymerase
LHILEELKRRGVEQAWLVGGAVRDRVSGMAEADVDVVCSETDIGALARKTGGVVVGRRDATVCAVLSGLGMPAPMAVDIAPLTGGSIEQDLGRRDFTVNAMAVDSGGNLIDPFGGEADVQAKVLRLVPSAPAWLPYEADPVRAVRLLRFACSLGFHIDEDTAAVTKGFVKHRGGLLIRVPRERLGKEFLKGFESRPHEFLTLLDGYGLLPLVLPEVEAMRGVAQPAEFHPEGDVLAHTFRVLAEVQSRGKDTILALAALLHDAGKPVTARPHPKRDHVCFFGHETEGEAIARATLTSWAAPGKLADRVAALVRCHMTPGGNVTERTCVRLIRSLGAEDAERLFALAMCDARGSMGEGTNIAEARVMLHRVMENFSEAGAGAGAHALPLNGHDVMRLLGIPPGRAVGRVLEELDGAVGSGEVRTREDAERFVLGLAADRLL